MLCLHEKEIGDTLFGALWICIARSDAVIYDELTTIMVIWTYISGKILIG